MLAALLWLAASLDASALVGQVVPPYPDGLVSRSGTCLAREPGDAHVCDYGVGLLEDAQGHARYVLAEQAAGVGGDGHPAWRVLDVMPYPPMGPDRVLAIAQCERDGVADGAILAVVALRDREWLEPAEHAWRLDFASGRFVEIATAGLRCMNEGYGFDG